MREGVNRLVILHPSSFDSPITAVNALGLSLYPCAGGVSPRYSGQRPCARQQQSLPRQYLRFAQIG
jgi:hypothetical protein